MHLSRTTIYGLTTRSSDNFALIERHDGHVVTQLMMTLLWQLTFVVDGNSTRIPTALTAIGIDGSCKDKQELLNETFNTTSLVFKDGLCIQREPNLWYFLKRLRNSLSHHRYEFPRVADSRNLEDVVFMMWDQEPGQDDDWKIEITGPDLRKVQQFVHDTIQPLVGNTVQVQQNLGVNL